MSIEYRFGNELNLDQVEDLYRASTLGERRPIDDRACQVKGLFVSERPAEPDEQPFLLAQWGAFLVQLEAIGIPRAAAAGWVTWPAVAIRLEATAVFEQTPGPQAGVQLR